MIDHAWLQVSYMAQIIVACLLFMIPVAKRRRFPARFASCTIVLLMIAYMFGAAVTVPDNLLLVILYWPAFAVICLPAVALCLQAGLSEVLYCTICANATQHAANECYLALSIALGRTTPDLPTLLNGLLTTVIYIAIYGAFFIMFARKLAVHGHYRVNRNDLFPMACILLFVWVLGVLCHDDVSLHGVVYHISDALCCFYIMWARRSNHDKAELQRELDGVRYTLLQQQKQYTVSQETIDIINRKCHDLKHQIRTLQTMQESPERDAYFAEAERAIMIYDTRIDTGNKALNTVLMEKGLYCQSHDIQLTCMPSGDSLDFMQVADIYALFGNALDNAINATMELNDPSKRVINVRFSSQGHLMLIQIQNYHQRRLRFRNGLPITTHQDATRHGFGMKSMLHTVEQYGGTMQVDDTDSVFTLRILLPKNPESSTG